MLGLGPVGVEGADLDPAVAAAPASVTGRRNARGAAGDRAGQRQPAGHALRGGEDARPEAAGGAQRDDVGGPAVGVRERASGSRGCRAPRRRGTRRSTGAGRRRRPGRGRRRRAARSSATWPGSVSWYSSTKTWRNASRSSARWSAASITRAADQVGVVGGARRSRMSRYWSRNSPAATSSGAPCSSPSRRSSAPSRPFSRARDRTALTSRAKPRVPSGAAAASRARRPTRGGR